MSLEKTDGGRVSLSLAGTGQGLSNVWTTSCAFRFHHSPSCSELLHKIHGKQSEATEKVRKENHHRCVHSSCELGSIL